MIVTLDPTSRDEVRLTTTRDGATETQSWSHALDPAGAQTIATLDELALGTSDTLRIVVGPGHFTSIRIAALIGNALRATRGTQLQTRRVDEEVWHDVTSVVPHYAAPPIITPAKNIG